jgi:hypothetical protein
MTFENSPYLINVHWHNIAMNNFIMDYYFGRLHNTLCRIMIEDFIQRNHDTAQDRTFSTH